MHQSPHKHFAGRREKYADLDIVDPYAERRAQRGSQPKARKFSPRDETARDTRWDKQSSNR